MIPPPGWYPDPAGSPDLRLWDGQTWTAQTMPATAAVAIAPPALNPPAEPVAPNSYYGTFIPGAREYSVPAAIQSSPYANNDWQPQSRSGGAQGILIKILIGIGVFIGLGILAAIAIPVFVSKQADIYHRTSVQMPATAAGFNKVTDSRADAFNDYFNELSIPGTHLAGLYSDPNGRPGAVLVIAKVPTSSPHYSEQLQDLEKGARESDSDGLTVGAFSNADPGPLGGLMQCAPFTVKTVTGRACGFVDGGAIGVVMTFDPDNQNLVLQLRSAMEQRS